MSPTYSGVELAYVSPCASRPSRALVLDFKNWMYFIAPALLVLVLGIDTVNATADPVVWAFVSEFV